MKNIEINGYYKTKGKRTKYHDKKNEMQTVDEIN